MNNLVYIGYITGIFGLKGGLKIASESNHNELIFKKNNTLYINNQEYEINNVIYHKKHYVIYLKGYEDINLINDFLKKEIFINHKDYPNIKYFTSELMNLKIIENNKQIGIIKEIMYNKNNILIKSDNLIIPLIDKYFIDIDLEKKEIYVKNVGELII